MFVQLPKLAVHFEPCGADLPDFAVVDQDREETSQQHDDQQADDDRDIAHRAAFGVERVDVGACDLLHHLGRLLHPRTVVAVEGILHRAVDIAVGALHVALFEQQPCQRIECHALAHGGAQVVGRRTDQVLLAAVGVAQLFVDERQPVGDHRPQVRVFDAGFVFGQEQIQRLAGFPRLAVHHGFELLARDGAFRQIADAQHVVELQRIAVTGFERGIGAGELFGEVGAVDVVVFALVFRRQTGRVDLMQDAEGFAVHAAVENGFGQIDPCTVDPRAVAVALGQGEHSAGVVVGRVDVVVVVLLVDLLRQGDPFARVFRCGEFVAPRCDAEILRAAVCVAPFDDTVELFERLLMAIGTVGTTRTDAEEQDGEKERERFHAFVFDSRFSPRRTPHGSGGLSCENSKKKRVDGGFDRFCCSAAGSRREIAATKKEETVAVSSFG